MTYAYSDFLILHMNLVSCSFLEHGNTYVFRHPPFDAMTTGGGVYLPPVI